MLVVLQKKKRKNNNCTTSDNKNIIVVMLLVTLSCILLPGVSALNTFGGISSPFNILNGLLSSPDDKRREVLKLELLELISKSSPPGQGNEFTTEEDRLRFEDLFYNELPALNPTFPNSARDSSLFSGEWECRWTNEKELNFLVRSGLFGDAWKRTYQRISIPEQQLENYILFGEDGESKLSVKSTLIPDETNGLRFNIQFYEASVNWRGFQIPIPPLGKGWGELLYLDDDMRLQRDIRGDCIVATKVKVVY